MKKYMRGSFLCGLVLVVLLAPVILIPSLSFSQDFEEESLEFHSSPETDETQRYENLTSLIHRVCDEASVLFRDFFGPGEVSLQPFMVIDEFNRKNLTMLGLTLADQMGARINNDSIFQAARNMEYEQSMQGILQEIDGFLRIHISGMNYRGERKSYIATIEMSEPVFRALYTDLGG